MTPTNQTAGRLSVGNQASLLNNFNFLIYTFFSLPGGNKVGSKFALQQIDVFGNPPHRRKSHHGMCNLT